MKKIAFSFLLVFEAVFLIYYSWLRIDNAGRVKEVRTFGDTGDYFDNAALPILSVEFWTDLRPPGTALFWKIVDSDPAGIFHLHLGFSILCWGILAFSVSKSLNAFLLKPLGFLTVLGFSLSRDIFMWDPFLGSESIAFSLMALFLALVLWALDEWKTYKVALVLVIAWLLVLTRDTFAYFLLMTIPVLLGSFWFSTYRRAVLMISLAFVLMFFVSADLAVRGDRTFRALAMNTSRRIYPSDTYTEYFRHHGMPVDEQLVLLARDPDPQDKFLVNKALLFDEDQEDFRQWARKSGRREYIKFLWFFKADTLQKVFNETAGQSFSPDVYYYTATGYRPILKDSRLAELLYPVRFGLVYFFGANVLAAFFIPIGWRLRKTLWIAPLSMILLTYPQAVLVWAADVNDIARHSLAHNILLRLGLWLLVFLVLDYCWNAVKPRVEEIFISRFANVRE
ncbi:MAG: hypothetical protein FJZ87_16355 [Chloroflexi bacterium]|nr:hypothetical protein [Chloroflexota bacterium]